MNDNPDTVPCTPTPADSGSNAASGTSVRSNRRKAGPISDFEVNMKA